MKEGGSGSFHDNSLIKKQPEIVLRAQNINQHKAKHQSALCDIMPYTYIRVFNGAQ